MDIKYYKIGQNTINISVLNGQIISAEFTDIKIKSSLKELLPLNLQGTKFQVKVWQALLQIPVGKTCTYQDIANSIGNKRASRAVANAIANNKIAYFIPCHRVIRKDGKLGGYKWGTQKKLELLKFEGASVYAKASSDKLK